MEELLRRILAAAAADERIRAVVLTGSRARPGAADALSDLDVELIGDDTAPLAADEDWPTRFAPIIVQVADRTDGGPTRLVIFAGGRKVDFSFKPRRFLAAITAAGTLPDLYERGYRVLLDKDGLTEGLPCATGTPRPQAPPTPEEFRATVEEFWFEAWHVGKYLARDDLWPAKFRDWATKELLLRMVEWDARTRRGWDHDTRHLGIGMAAWGNVEVWRRLHAAFGRFDAADAWSALAATTRLFGDLTRNVAAVLSYHTHDALERDVLALLADLRRGPGGDTG